MRMDSKLKCKNKKNVKTDKSGKISIVEAEIKGTCPQCGGNLIEKRGRFGRFFACSNYPDCKYTESYSLGFACPMEGCTGKLVEKISYKCKLVGIDFQVHEESYTSKVDHLAFEKLGKHDVYLGKRKKRGLFQSSIGKLINADINGAIGIGRKVFGDSYVSKIIDSGLAFNPVRVNIL